MSDGGKGSSPRPFSVPIEQFEKNWDAIFKKEKTNEDGEVLLGKFIEDKEKVSED